MTWKAKDAVQYSGLHIAPINRGEFMKRLFTLKTLSLSILLAMTHPFAAKAIGGASPGGGDRCEERFKSVTEDIQKWIHEGGAQSLDFRAIPFAVTADTYSQAMLQQIAGARVTCVGPGDSGYPVQVNGSAKECLNFIDELGVSRILCDRAKFYSEMANPENDTAQYRIVHHELASLAGLEIPNGDDSTYTLSKQITQFLEDQIVKRLAVRTTRSQETLPGRHVEFCILTSDDFTQPTPLQKSIRAFCNDGRGHPGFFYRTFRQPMHASFQVEQIRIWTPAKEAAAREKFKYQTLSRGYIHERTVLRNGNEPVKIISKMRLTAQHICLVNAGHLYACSEGLKLASNATNPGPAVDLLRANGFSKIGALTPTENFDWNLSELEIYAR